jgi:hypothetical protein
MLDLSQRLTSETGLKYDSRQLVRFLPLSCEHIPKLDTLAFGHNPS